MLREKVQSQPIARTDTAAEAASYATFGCPVWTKPLLVQSGTKDLDEIRRRGSYELDPAHPIPAGYCDRRNTWHTTLSVSKIRNDFRSGLLAARAPYHLLFAMASAAVNKRKLLQGHCQEAKHFVMFAAPPADETDLANIAAPPYVHQGYPQHEIFEDSGEAAGAGSYLGPIQPENRIHVEGPDEAVALITAGYTFDQGTTIYRRDGKKIYLRLTFDSKSGPGMLDHHLRIMRGEVSDLIKGDLASVNVSFVHRFLINARVLAGTMRTAYQGDEALGLIVQPHQLQRRGRSGRRTGLVERFAAGNMGAVEGSIDKLVKHLGIPKRHF
ncbi:MAG: hypothetical protein AAF236_02185 [Verrucomicrobiota bacterium]